MRCPNCNCKMILVTHTNTYIIYQCPACGRRETIVMHRER